MIAICSLCDREQEVEPLGRAESFFIFCDNCLGGIKTRNPDLKLDTLAPKEKRGLLQAGEIALALLEDRTP